jgi:hypothetical protein
MLSEFTYFIFTTIDTTFITTDTTFITKHIYFINFTSNFVISAPFFFFFLFEIEIYTTHMHTVFEKGKDDSNLANCGREFPSTTGQMPSGLLHHNSKPGTKSKATVKRTNHPGRHL